MSHDLTDQEHRIMRSLMAGLTSAETAPLFNVTIKTIKHYKSRIYSKLNARNAAQAVAIYLTRYGVTPDGI